MSERYRIRAGVGSDVARVVALDRATELLPHWSEAEYAQAASYSDSHPGCEAAKSGKDRCLFVAEADRQIVGFIVAAATVLPTEVLAELESVAVATAERRLGIGGSLCEAALEWSRRQGAREMDLEVRSRSEGAIALYRKLGFTVVGRRSQYYRDPMDDAVLMRIGLEKA